MGTHAQRTREGGEAKAPGPAPAPAAAAASRPGALTPEGAERLVAEVASYADLEPGWAPHDGEVPGPRARANACAFLRALAAMGGVAPPEVDPRGDGGVDLSWGSVHGPLYFSLTFLDDDTLGWVADAPGIEEDDDCEPSYVPGGGVPDRLLPWLARVAAALGAGAGKAPPRGGGGGRRARMAGRGEPGRRRRGRAAPDRAEARPRGGRRRGAEAPRIRRRVGQGAVRLCRGPRRRGGDSIPARGAVRPARRGRGR